MRVFKEQNRPKTNPMSQAKLLEKLFKVAKIPRNRIKLISLKTRYAAGVANPAPKPVSTRPIIKCPKVEAHKVAIQPKISRRILIRMLHRQPILSVRNPPRIVPIIIMIEITLTAKGNYITRNVI